VGITLAALERGGRLYIAMNRPYKSIIHIARYQYQDAIESRDFVERSLEISTAIPAADASPPS